MTSINLSLRLANLSTSLGFETTTSVPGSPSGRSGEPALTHTVQNGETLSCICECVSRCSVCAVRSLLLLPCAHAPARVVARTPCTC